MKRGFAADHFLRHDSSASWEGEEGRLPDPSGGMTYGDQVVPRPLSARHAFPLFKHCATPGVVHDLPCMYLLQNRKDNIWEPWSCVKRSARSCLLEECLEAEFCHFTFCWTWWRSHPPSPFPRRDLTLSTDGLRHHFIVNNALAASGEHQQM